MVEETAQCAVFLNGCVRNLNRRTARLERFALLVSVDSLTLFSPLANDPPGHHSDRSPTDVVRDSSTPLRSARNDTLFCTLRCSGWIPERERARRFCDAPASFVRNLSRRDCPLGSSLASVDLSSDEISATGSPQSFALLRMTSIRSGVLLKRLEEFRILHFSFFILHFTITDSGISNCASLHRRRSAGRCDP